MVTSTRSSKNSVFEGSINISDDKITKRRRKKEEVLIPFETMNVTETLLEDSTFIAEDLRGSDTFTNEKFFKPTKDNTDLETASSLNSTLIVSRPSSKLLFLENNDEKWKGLKKIKASINGLFTEMLKECNDEKAFEYHHDVVASYCAFVYRTCDK